MESSGRPSEITVINIPWYDVLFKYVFTRLSLKDLFHLRQVSTELKLAVSEYFKCNKCVDLTEIYDTFNDKAFSLATREASCIRYLFLHNCKWLTEDSIRSVLEKNKNILHFDISGCSPISDACIQILAINAKNLQKLYLKNCYWISSSAVTSLAIHCSDLEHVDLTSCEQVRDEDICKLVSHCPRLKFLSMSQIYEITDKSLNMIARKCKLLEELDLSCCYMVTDRGIKLIGELCESLKFLKVGSCRHVTEYSLASLRVRMHIDQEIISTRWSYEKYRLLKQGLPTKKTHCFGGTYPHYPHRSNYLGCKSLHDLHQRQKHDYSVHLENTFQNQFYQPNGFSSSHLQPNVYNTQNFPQQANPSSYYPTEQE